ncbi:MAG TPA: histidine phosphatase family protein [Armatimonadetes bacterium]|nr:histidine phosphatase family protein [Armatimonadota bacterium]
MTRIYLIRHGEVLWNREHPAYCGHTDLELNERGREQAGCVAQRLADAELSAVYCSDLRRARDTAAAIAARHGLEPVADPALREVNYGEWEGVSEEDVRAGWPDHYAAWKRDAEKVRIPGGESFGELRDRLVPALTAIAERHAGENVAVVAHKSSNRAFLCAVLGLSPSLYRRIGQENAAVNLITYEDGRWRIDLINDTCHLRLPGHSG